ncbi:MAG TPA: hypothetical protein VF507_07670 [Pyrinomonadaceae bacterium]
MGQQPRQPLLGVAIREHFEATLDLSEPGAEREQDGGEHVTVSARA